MRKSVGKFYNFSANFLRFSHTFNCKQQPKARRLTSWLLEQPKDGDGRNQLVGNPWYFLFVCYYLHHQSLKIIRAIKREQKDKREAKALIIDCLMYHSPWYKLVDYRSFSWCIQEDLEVPLDRHRRHWLQSTMNFQKNIKYFPCKTGNV